MNEKILVVDDERKITEVVRAYLEKEGYIVLVAGDGQGALDLIERSKPDLVILDLMLPDMAGEEICRRLRQRSDVPIIMLTAKASEEERVKGLMIGADDYIVKPFSPKELVARVRAILRRVRRDSEALRDRLSFHNGSLTIDLIRHEVKRNGKLVPLTAYEYKLLVALAQHPGRVYSRLQLVNKVQGYDFEGYERTIDAHIKNLRKKIEPDPKNPRYIQTVYGMGYKFEGEEDV
ncbi:MAG TPA: response regulator transcription factor [Candidatus Latescibacteria bacterium]|nr:response regulator transcription factor [Candidatus Latescibacterota bacterium]